MFWQSLYLCYLMAPINSDAHFALIDGINSDDKTKAVKAFNKYCKI